MQSTYDRIQYYKIDAEKKKAITNKLKVLLTKEKRIKLAWLFGSITNHVTIRDVDVAIHAQPELSFPEYLDLNAHIELELGLPVDLVEIAKVPKSLKQKIYCEGILFKGNRAQQEQLQRNDLL